MRSPHSMLLIFLNEQTRPILVALLIAITLLISSAGAAAASSRLWTPTG